MVDFRQLNAKPVAEIKKPPVLPAGTYIGITGSNHFLGEAKNDKKTPFVEYALQLQQATEGIDPELLAGIDLSRKQFKATFYLSDDSQYRYVEFIKSTGFDTNGRSLGELWMEGCNKQVLVDLVVKPNRNNPEETYNEVNRVRGMPA